MPKYQFKTHQKLYFPLKRAIDIFGSLLGIIVLSPILILAAIITKCTSKGPILFKQERVGKNEKIFKMYKFRSMRADAPQIAPHDMDFNTQQSLITKWGKLMRKTSIDELPQLFNILGGSMSFIGPRPGQTREHESDLIEEREKTFPSAFEVKPGLSGYAQVRLRRDHSPQKKALYDSSYVKRISLWFDIKIFVYSFLVLFGFDKGR